MLKSVGRELVRRLGYDLVNIRRARADAERRESERWTWLRKANVGTVVDIGASVGEFSGWVVGELPGTLLYSFEPIEHCYTELLKRMKGYADFRSFNLGLSDVAGDVDFYLSEFSPSSSLLPMADLHRRLFPYTSNVVTRKVKVVRLDDISEQIVTRGNVLIKVDVQGAEDKVIRGGSVFFERSHIVLIEVSYDVLYQGQPLFGDIHLRLSEMGYQYMGNMGQSSRPVDGLPMYADALFIKSELVPEIAGP
jgi:FkbM family methyltransferase